MYILYINSRSVGEYTFQIDAYDAFDTACEAFQGCIELMHPDGGLDMYRPF